MDEKLYLILLLLVLAISLITLLFNRTWKQIKRFYERLNKISIPNTIVLKNLNKGKYYIFVDHPNAILPTAFAKNKCNFKIASRINCEIRELSSNKNIELDDCTGDYSARYYRIFSAYSIRSFWISNPSDIKLEVWFKHSMDKDTKVFISKSLCSKFIFGFFIQAFCIIGTFVILCQLVIQFLY